MSGRPDFLLAPITALAFLDVEDGCAGNRPAVLAAEGHTLRLLDLEGQSRSPGSFDTFGSQPIHGLDIKHGKALVWGGESIAVLPDVSRLESRSPFQGMRGERTLSVTEAPDWIFDGSFHPSDPTTFALITAHNEVVIGTTGGSQNDKISLSGDLISPSRPMLYSAKLMWLLDTCLLVAAGTVFGEIIVWRCHLDHGQVDSRPRAEVVHVLTGHEGSIFDIDISPEIEIVPDIKIRLLASCSDDRTIRLWDISDSRCPISNASTPPISGGNAALLGMSKARETGFGENSALERQESQKPAMVEMAHISRIWKLLFGTRRQSESGTSVSIFSFGEDSTIHQWHLDISSTRHRDILQSGADLSSLEFIRDQTYTLHNGKHIWSAAILSRCGQDLVVTGGADGRIAVVGNTHDESGYESFGYCEPLEVSITNVLAALPLNGMPSSNTTTERNQRDWKASFNRYAFVTPSDLLAMSTTGRPFIYSFLEGKWENIDVSNGVEATIGAYSVLTSLGDGLAFIGTSKGQLYWYSHKTYGFGQLCQQATLTSKISSIWSLGRESNGDEVQLLVTIQGSPVAQIFFLGILDGLPNVKHIVAINLDPRFLITAAVAYKKYLILGSRTGFLSIFHYTEGRIYVSVLSDQYICSDAITSIVPLPEQLTPGLGGFLTTTRDGKYRIFTSSSSLPSDTDTDRITITKIHETSPPFGPMIEGAWFQPSSSTTSSSRTYDLVICGFKSKHFIIWNATHRLPIASILCGGAHRSFAHTHSLSPRLSEAVRFAYTKSSTMHVHSQQTSGHRILTSGGHGREIRAADSDHNGLVATGAEDTTVRIWEYSDQPHGGDGGGGAEGDEVIGGRKFKCLAVMESHTSGIQNILFHRKGGLLFTSGGNEEFYIWKLTKLNPPLAALAVTRHAKLEDKSTGGDLRIMDFCINDIPPPPLALSGQGKGNGDDGVAIIITMAFSNSTIKTYLYRDTIGFTLLAMARYTGACIMQVRHLDLSIASASPHEETKEKEEEEEEEEEGRLVVLSAATDGFISIWSFSLSLQRNSGRIIEQTKPILSYKLHQNAIKALSLSLFSPRPSIPSSSSEEEESTYCPMSGEKKFLLATGGDDNALGISMLTLSIPHSPKPGCAASAAPVVEACVETKFLVPSAHATALSGVLVVGSVGSADGVVRIITSSCDQRVKTWEITMTIGGGGVWTGVQRVKLVENWYSDVADPGVLTWLLRPKKKKEEEGEEEGEEEMEGKVMVAGVGVEVWSVGGREGGRKELEKRL